jgi:hypothetical protein
MRAEGRQREVLETMQECDQNGHQRSEEVLIGRKEWREQHPQVTVTESEAARKKRVGRFRAHLLQKVAWVSTSNNRKQSSSKGRPRCPLCGTPLAARGQTTRRLPTQGGQEIALTARTSWLTTIGCSFAARERLTGVQSSDVTARRQSGGAVLRLQNTPARTR